MTWFATISMDEDRPSSLEKNENTEINGLVRRLLAHLRCGIVNDI
jgi:hypothetical protein